MGQGYRDHGGSGSGSTKRPRAACVALARSFGPVASTWPARPQPEAKAHPPVLPLELAGSGIHDCAVASLCPSQPSRPPLPETTPPPADPSLSTTPG